MVPLNAVPLQARLELRRWRAAVRARLRRVRAETKMSRVHELEQQLARRAAPARADARSPAAGARKVL